VSVANENVSGFAPRGTSKARQTLRDWPVLSLSSPRLRVVVDAVALVGEAQHDADQPASGLPPRRNRRVATPRMEEMRVIMAAEAWSARRRLSFRQQP